MSSLWVTHRTLCNCWIEDRKKPLLRVSLHHCDIIPGYTPRIGHAPWSGLDPSTCPETMDRSHWHLQHWEGQLLLVHHCSITTETSNVVLVLDSVCVVAIVTHQVLDGVNMSRDWKRGRKRGREGEWEEGEWEREGIFIMNKWCCIQQACAATVLQSFKNALFDLLEELLKPIACIYLTLQKCTRH